MLQQDVAAALPEMRLHAESLMVDTVFVETPTGSTTIDPDTLAEVDEYAEVYSGPGRVQRSGALSPRDTVSGGYEFGIGTPIVQLPIAATGILKGDRVTVTAIGPQTDADLAGLVATVQANLAKTHATKRTLACQEVS